jgi:hypothetical protein
MPDLTRLLGAREGPRPSTRKGIPHAQLDQFPPPEIAAKLADRILSLPHAIVRESRLTASGCRAICLPGEFACGPQCAFIDDHEFCHIHPAPECHLHLTLPDKVREEIAQLNWVEYHPLAGVGFLPKTMMMVYAPRNEQELESVVRIVGVSYEFARGNMQ